MPGALIRPVTRRAFNFLIPRTGQRHDRIVDMLDIWIRGWEEGKLAVEIGEEIWRNLKTKSPVMKDRATFLLEALRSGCGVGDFMAWYISTGGKWDDDPKKIGSLDSAQDGRGGSSLEEGSGRCEAGVADLEDGSPKED